MEKHYNVLFLCTGNSARSIMAEGILNGKKNPHFTAYSAGSFPSGKVRPEALHQLELAKLPTEGARSKSWSEFAAARRTGDGFRFHGVRQRGERGLPDLARAADDGALGRCGSRRGGRDTEQIERAFRDAFVTMGRRINLFLSLPLASLDQLAIKKEVDRIGKQ